MVMDRISAFMDGEAAERESHEVLRHLQEHPDCRESWATFHLIGDLMRGDRTLRADFMRRFQDRLEQEPTVLAPRLRWRRAATYAFSAAAAIAAVVLVGTLITVDNPLNPPAPAIAVVPKDEPMQVATSAMRLPTEAERAASQVASNRMNGYLMAHQEFSPSTALEGVAAYVRTVSATSDEPNQ
jgi:sigma-E factor negative regulatory protein RseA